MLVDLFLLAVIEFKVSVCLNFGFDVNVFKGRDSSLKALDVFDLFVEP